MGVLDISLITICNTITKYTKDESATYICTSTLLYSNAVECQECFDDETSLFIVSHTEQFINKNSPQCKMQNNTKLNLEENTQKIDLPFRAQRNVLNFMLLLLVVLMQ